MQFIYEFVPVLLFFLVFKFYGIYEATVVGIVATAAQVLLTRIIKKSYDKKQLVTLGVFSLFGGMTLYFHNPIFVKWKPTIVFWLFGIILLGTRFFSRKSLLERMFDGVKTDQPLSIPENIWRKLNYAWAFFFILLGAINLYIAYQCTTATWVNFKFYGIFGLLLLFSVLQAIYLSRHVPKS